MRESVNFDPASSFYDATRGFPDDVAPEIGAFIADKAKLSKDDTLLEIGIGTGRIALPLAPHVKMIAGADISSAMMQVLLEKRTNEGVFPVQADGYQLPYADNSFDAVVIVHVLHLVPNPVAILDDVKRVLKPDGHLLHCFSARESDIKSNPVVKAWNDNRPKRRKGYNWQQTANALDETRWHLKEEITHHYTYTETPRTLYDNVANKVWSSLWDVSDDILQPALSAITEAVELHYDGDFQAEMTRTSGLTMQIFELPE